MTIAWSDAQVRAALALPPSVEMSPPRFDRVVTDTRTIQRGDLFVALVGERFDAHRFLEGARDVGALGAVVRVGTAPVTGLTLYEVPDTLFALGQLAAARRDRFLGPIVAITGQNGKTSTKEMVAAVLATRWRTHRTRANDNNLIGVPLTVLQAPADTEAMVVEAGANMPGEIPRYRDILRPDIAVVTNAGAGHLEGFGSVAAVVREKLALTRGAPVAIVGVEPPELVTGAKALAQRVVTAGLSGTDIHPTAVQVAADGCPDVTVEGRTFHLAARGRHQAGNAMFAWGVAKELGLDLDLAAEALEQFAIPGGRGELSQHGRLTVLNDGYNANPHSFASAMALAGDLRIGRTLVFVAGTMKELGPFSDELHAEVASALAALDPELLALVGEFVPAFAPYRAAFAGRLLEAPDADSMGPMLAARLVGDELVVLKGSRGAALERILPAILPHTVSTD